MTGRISHGRGKTTINPRRDTTIATVLTKPKSHIRTKRPNQAQEALRFIEVPFMLFYGIFPCT